MKTTFENWWSARPSYRESDRAAAEEAWNAAMTNNRYIEWALSDDVGISSKTMLAIHCGVTIEDLDAPYDPSDFGRCYRLVQHIPEIKNSFSAIAAAVPDFAKIIEHWDELCSLYDIEIKNKDGRAPKLYKRIKELRP